MALPVIVGQIVRDVLLRHVGGSSNKEYRITVSRDASGNAYCYSSYGPTGNLHSGKLETSTPCTIWAAERKADELVEKKLNHPKTPYTIIRDLVPSLAQTPPVEPPVAPQPIQARPKAAAPRSLSTAGKAVFNNLF